MPKDRTAPQRPTWRRFYDEFERQFGPRTVDLMRSRAVGDMFGVMARSNRALRDTMGQVSSGVLHMFNIPAATDLSRILREIGAVKKQLRVLQAGIEAGRSGDSDGDR